MNPRIAFIKYLWLLAGITCFLPLHLQAQAERGSFGRFELGFSFMDHKDLNMALVEMEYGEVSNTIFSLGASWDNFRGRWVYGGKLYGYALSQSNIFNQVAILEHFYGQLHTGVVLAQKDQVWKIYPTIGLGWGLSNLKTKAQTSRRPYGHLSQGGVVDFSVNSRHYKEFDTENGNDYLVELGLSVGYMHAFGGQNHWQLDDFVPDKRVQVNPGGPYFRLSLGLGKFR